MSDPQAGAAAPPAAPRGGGFARSLAIIASPPILLLLLFAGFGALATVLGLHFAGGWLTAGFACILFYAAMMLLFRDGRRRASRAQAVLAGLFTLLAWIPLALAVLALGDDRLFVPVTFAVLTCAPAASGVNAPLVGRLLLVAGAMQFILNGLELWPLIHETIEFDWVGVKIDMGDPGPYEYIRATFRLVLSLLTIYAAALVGLCRPYPRYRLVALCIIAIGVFWFSRYSFPRVSLLWLSLDINDGLVMGGGWVKYEFAWIVFYALALLFLLGTPVSARVWKGAIHAPRVAHPEPAGAARVVAVTGGEDWHGALLNSLQSTGIQRTQNATGRMLLAFLCLAGLALGWGALNYVAPALEHLQGATYYYPELDWMVWLAELAIGAFVVFRAESVLRRYIAQLRATGAEAEVAKQGGRRPVFYLRSFSIERWDRPRLREFLFGPPASDEEKMVPVLQRSGPVIAIGQPNEKLPRLGAARFYVSDELWKQKVADVAAVSRLILWTSGTSEGLRWELGHLLESVGADKLILWAHPHLLHLPAPSREAEWSRFREQLGTLFPKPLPERLGNARLFYFDAAGEVVAVAPGWVLSRLLFGAQGSACRRLLRAKGMPRRSRSN